MGIQAGCHTVRVVAWGSCGGLFHPCQPRLLAATVVNQDGGCLDARSGVEKVRQGVDNTSEAGGGSVGRSSALVLSATR